MQNSTQKHGRLVASIIILCLAIYWITPPVWTLVGGSTTVTQWKKSTGAKQVKVGPDQANWIAIRNVSRHVLYAFIAAEDAHFYDHWGLDINEIYKSVELNLKKNRFARGASTITQQVVKMAFLSRDKSLVRKIREAAGALTLELIMDKDGILEWYLNLAEFGDGVYGLRSASQHYFQTKPELLTIQQAAHLALVLPSPNGWSVGLRRRDLTDFGHRRFAYIVTQMKLTGYITDTQWLNALATGNFGRPLHSYDRIIAKVRKKESVATSEELEDLPFPSDDTPWEETQIDNETHEDREGLEENELDRDVPDKDEPERLLSE